MTTSSTTPGRVNENSPSRLAAYAFGAIYLLVGLVGFAVTGFDDFIGTNTNEFLLFFEVNPLHNVVHILIGALLLAAASKSNLAARSANLTVAAVYAVVGVIGLFILGTEANILSLNGADNVLHFATAIVLGAVALYDQSRSRTTATL